MRQLFLMVLALTFIGCAQLKPLNNPQISLAGIESVRSSSMAPRFKLKLLVTNPNDIDLEIDGVAFEFNVADKKLLSGVANNIPTLKAYAETEIEVQASVSFMQLWQLFSTLSKENSKNLTYLLSTTIDPKGFVAFEVEQRGNFNDTLKSNFKPSNFN